MTREDILFIKEDVQTILDQQMVISQLSEGGITFSDTDNMDTYERSYIFTKLVSMKREEIEAKQKAYDEMKNKTRG